MSEQPMYLSKRQCCVCGRTDSFNEDGWVIVASLFKEPAYRCPDHAEPGFKPAGSSDGGDSDG